MVILRIHIQGHDLAPVLLAHALGRAKGPRPGVVDEEIDLPKLGQDLLHHRPHALTLGHVGVHEQSRWPSASSCATIAGPVSGSISAMAIAAPACAHART